MESQLQRQHGHHGYEEEPRHSVVEGEGEGEGEGVHHHGEKKSVLTKVKDKAKKIKDAIKKHGHGHDHGHNLEEEDDEDEQMMDDPQVHGSPRGEEADVAPRVGQFDKMNVLDQTDPKSKPDSESSKIRTSSCPENPESTLKRLDPGKTEDFPRDTVTGKLSYATSAIADKAATSAIADSPVVGREEANVGQTKVKIGQSVHSPSGVIPPSNYQSKVVDPKGTGGGEADVAPLVGQFDKMNVLDQTDSKSKSESESESSKMRTSSFPENPESTLKRLDPGKTEDMPRDTVTGKLSYATSANADKAATSAIADSPVVGREEANVGQTKVKIGQSVHSPSGAIPPSNYQSKVVDPKGTGGGEADVAPLVGQFDKMNVLDQTDSKSKSESESSKMRTSSFPENPESTLKRLDPGKTEDMPRDTATGKLSYATSAIADKAATSAIADSPVVGREEANVGQTKVKIGQSVHSPSGAIPPSNYQSKVVDPKGTGGGEADVAPLVGQFDKMNVLDQTDSKSKSESESSKMRTSSFPENPESTLKRLDPGKTEDMPRDTVTGKLSYATSAIADSPVMGREEANLGQTKVKIGQSVHSPSGAIPPSNYPSKVVDPKGTGGGEADVAPLVGQFDKMNVLDQTDSKSKSESESSKMRTSSFPENPESTLKRLDPGKTEDMPRDTVTGKLSYATSANADKAATSAIADSPVVGREEADVGQTKVKIGQSVHSPSGAIPPSNYQSKVVDPKGTGGEEADVAPLVGQFDKMNVLDQTDSKSKSESESESSKIRTSSCPENPESTLKRLDPGKTEDMPRDTVTGKLSYVTSAIADMAISAKNATASKLGYGGHEEGQDSQKDTSESAQSVAATMTEKSAPVYHKVVDASSSVMSEVQGSGTRDEGGDGATLVGNEGKGTDKGFSVKDCLVEKFRPGDEDKALSEAISGALHKKKGETGKPVGEVTESRLGTGSENKREGEDVLSAGNESKGTGMVDRIKDAVGWLGKSAGMQTAQDSPAQSNLSDTVSTPTPTPTPT